MGRDRREDVTTRRLRLQERAEAEPTEEAGTKEEFVFDFTGLHQPDLTDLSLILTARLQADAGDRVWVRALPLGTWRTLHALNLHHLFQPYPVANGGVN